MSDLYKDWNLLLLREYFSPAVAGEEVWILTSKAELDSFGFHLGGAGGLVDAVKNGPSWCAQKHAGMARTAMNLAKQRLAPTQRPTGYQDPGGSVDAYRRQNAPTYLPYVALWVLAASEMSQEGFYKTVSNLVDLPFEGATARSAMEALWRDLEYWSGRQLDGDFGIFHSRPLGGYPFVGLAKAQALITGKDREGINRLFKQADLSAGQDLSESEFLDLIKIAVDSHYLSKSLLEALGDMKTYGPVLREIFRSRLLEWNGRVPTANRINAQQDHVDNDSSDQASLEFEDELSLVLRPSFDVDWEIGWRFQSNVDAEGYALDIGDTNYRGYADESTGYVTCLDSENIKQIAARSVFSATSDDATLATVSYTRSGDVNGQVSRAYSFPSKCIRLLNWDTPNPAHGQELVERELPIAGPVYLLTSDVMTFDFLDENFISYRKMEGECGLPEGWVLLVIDSVESLSILQKRAIQRHVGDVVDSIARARIKFTSGCPILRGGTKQYSDYDLPLVELDAPIGTEIEVEGLRLEELTHSVPSSSDYHQTSIRRFLIHREDNTKHRFELVASLSQEILCKANLKVALSVGVETGLEKAFSIGRFGESLRSSAGIRGAILDTVSDKYLPIALANFPETVMGRKDTSSNEYDNHVRNNIACKLVDMLAQKGSIEYGAAKRLVIRLAQDVPEMGVKPAILMLELRSRGFLELETDQKGHLLRLHAANPVIYSTPVAVNNGGQWYGVCGSLRLEHWRQLSSQTGVSARIELHSTDCIPTLRLSITNDVSLQRLLDKCNFQYVDLPAVAIYRWAYTLKETRERLILNKGYESFRVKNLQRLNPQSVLFSHDRSAYMKVDASRKCELFKIDDPVIQGSQAYMLGSLVEDGVDYNYIQDSRWGVWLAISSFAQMISNLGIYEDAYPWPIPYSQEDGSFWLPARMKPPLVLERALCLSSGVKPEQVRVSGDSTVDDDLLELVNTAAGGKAIGKVSRLYTEMCDGTWLRYKYVSEEIANEIAANLGCKLMYL